MAKRLVYVGPLAPPVTGASLVTTRMLERVEQRASTAGCDVKVVDFKGSAKSGWVAAASRRLAACSRGIGLVFTRPDSLYVSLPGGASIVALIPIFGLARTFKVRLYLHHHSFAYLTRRSRLFGLTFRLAGSTATHLVLCGGMGRALKTTYPVTRTRVILSNYAFLNQQPVPERTITRDEQAPIVLGHYSNLDAVKGLDTVLAACRDLSDRGFSYRLILAGPAANVEADRQIKEALKEMPEIEWLGALRQEDVAGYFARVDVLLFPSRYRNEAQPMVVLEAALNGVPTLATNIGCLPEMPSVRVLEPSQSLADAIVDFSRSSERPSDLVASTGGNIEREEHQLDAVINSMLS